MTIPFDLKGANHSFPNKTQEINVMSIFFTILNFILTQAFF